ncbi:MAG: hypothetical protein KGV56_06215 [Gammaproteobacteria bacterium]|nr:hypothetical protein [Gammaproteobacteria bacterium]
MKRNPCYCKAVAREVLESEGIPAGYCAFCDICNKPGHLQHFPGAVPYTGAWCDSCFIKIKRKHQLKIFCLFALIFVVLCFF